MRLRFSSGLTLGLAAGIPVGALLAVLLSPRSQDGGAMTLRVQELTRQLDAAREARERADRQLDQFQKLADQMTVSFKSLEERFNALQAEESQRDAAAANPAAVAATPPSHDGTTPAPAPALPEAPE
jgi:hypothetical protein